jgi:probable addiction module antidote protein
MHFAGASARAFLQNHGGLVTWKAAAYLEAAFEDGDPSLIAAALGDIARAIGMTQLATQAGVTREALYKALSASGDPRLSTFLGVMKALGLKLTPHAA